MQPKSDAPTPFNIYRKFVASMEEGEEPVEADAVDAVKVEEEVLFV